MAAKISPTSENYGSESNNDRATEIEESEDESMDIYSSLSKACLTWKLCICNVDFVNFNLYCVLSLKLIIIIFHIYYV